MKVHTLDIDSSARDVTLYPNASSYVVNLKTPIYNVSEFKLVSARIPTTQLLICDTNNTFTLDDGGNSYEIALSPGNYSTTSLKNELQAKLAATISNYTVTIGPNKAFVITAYVSALLGPLPDLASATLDGNINGTLCICVWPR